MDQRKELKHSRRERAETKMVRGLEDKVDSVIRTVKQLASKAVEHKRALASMQQKMVTMEKVLEDLSNRKKEVPSYRDVASREGGRVVASRVREIEVASRERYSEMSSRESDEEGAVREGGRCPAGIEVKRQRPQSAEAGGCLGERKR